MGVGWRGWLCKVTHVDTLHAASRCERRYTAGAGLTCRSQWRVVGVTLDALVRRRPEATPEHKFNVQRPLSSEYGTYEIFEANVWHFISVKKSFTPFKLLLFRSEAAATRIGFNEATLVSRPLALSTDAVLGPQQSSFIYGNILI